MEQNVGQLERRKNIFSRKQRLIKGVIQRHRVKRVDIRKELGVNTRYNILEALFNVDLHDNLITLAHLCNFLTQRESQRNETTLLWTCIENGSDQRSESSC